MGPEHIRIAWVTDIHGKRSRGGFTIFGLGVMWNNIVALKEQRLAVKAMPIISLEGLTYATDIMVTADTALELLTFND